MNTKISFFKKAFVKEPSKEITIKEILESIRNGEYSRLINELRSEKDKTKYEISKKYLPAVTFSGIFNIRNKINLKSYSGYIVLDIDKLPSDEYAKNLRNLIAKLDFTAATFISPSGKGIKVLVKVNCEPKDHKETYVLLTKYYNLSIPNIEFEFDTSTIDICRLCFLSFDPDIYIKKTINCFDKSTIDPNLMLKMTEETDNLKLKSILLQLEEDNIKFEDGNRNNFIFYLACRANRIGIFKIRILKFVVSKYENQTFDSNEIEKIINGVYSRYIEEHGKFFYQIHKNDSNIIKKDIKDELEQIGLKEKHFTEEIFTNCLLKIFYNLDTHGHLKNTFIESLIEIIDMIKHPICRMILNKIMLNEEVSFNEILEEIQEASVFFEDITLPTYNEFAWRIISAQFKVKMLIYKFQHLTKELIICSYADSPKKKEELKYIANIQSGFNLEVIKLLELHSQKPI